MQQPGLDTVAGWVVDARRVTVLTGAGISTDSGIPDFRGPNGLWTRDPTVTRLYTLKAYLSDPDVRRQAWRNRRQHAAWEAAPNRSHLALAEMETEGRLRSIVTQNIDGLHQRAGNSDDKVIELHGSLYEVECVSCGSRYAMSDVLERVDDGEEDPPCLACGGILKSATISFGQPLVPEVLAAAKEAVIDCDLLLVVGSSLSVQPAAGLVQVAHDAGVKVVIINASPTPYDSIADAVLRGSVGDVLPPLVETIGETTAATEGAT